VATCPRCGTELTGEFGMCQCSSCGAFSFIGDDGIARAPEDEAPPIETQAKPAPRGGTNPGFQPMGFEPGGFSAERSSPKIETPEVTEEPPFAFDPVPSSIIDVPSSPENAGESYGLDSFQPMEPATVDVANPFDDNDVPSGSGSTNNDAFENFGSGSDESLNSGDSFNSGGDAFGSGSGSSGYQPETQEEPPQQDIGPASDPLGLNEFANSEVSSGRDGPLLFRVILSGIDTKEIRESIREVLNDDRFRLDPQAIMQKVSKGNLVIDGLSPVKASIFVTRIKRLPITIRWEQYAITQANR
jgi:hypothetical protein